MIPISQGFTLDASCVAKLAVDEADATSFRLLHSFLSELGAVMTGPTLLSYELGRVLARRFPPSAARQAHADVLGLVPTTPHRLQAAFDQPRLSFYDASYACHAVEHGNLLLTYDVRLASASRPDLVSTPSLKKWDHPSFGEWIQRIDVKEARRLGVLEADGKNSAPAVWNRIDPERRAELRPIFLEAFQRWLTRNDAVAP